MKLNDLSKRVLTTACEKIKHSEIELVGKYYEVHVNYYITTTEIDLINKVMKKAKFGFISYNVHSQCVLKFVPSALAKYTNGELSIMLLHSEDYESLVNAIAHHVFWQYVRLQKYTNVETEEPPRKNNIIKLTMIDNYDGSPIRSIYNTDNKFIRFINKYKNDERFVSNFEQKSNRIYMTLNPKLAYEFINMHKCISLFYQEDYYGILGEVSQTMFDVLHERESVNV